jgi:hypothetical protein
MPARLDGGSVPDLDRYECFKARADRVQKIQRSEIQADGAFGSRDTVVLKLASHCVPVEVNGVGRTGAGEQLTCYKSKDGADEPPFARQNVSVRDAFGTRGAELVKPVRFCVFSRDATQAP